MLPCQRHLFDIPGDVAYLNCAYMSPLMKSALEAGTAGLARKAHPWEITPDKFFTGSEEFRRTAAQLIDSSSDDIAIVSSASYGIAAAARNLPLSKGQSILVLEEQFPSHYYAWQRRAEETGAQLKVVPWPRDDEQDWTATVLYALTEDVAIVALPNVQWTSGGRLDLVRIGEVCRKLGAALVLDLTQSLGALPFSVRDVRPDFAVAASYKWLLGPYSVGFFYVAPHRQNGMPLEENWIQRGNARDFSSLILYTDDYDAGARRFDMGERSNFALLPAAVRAMKQLLEWKIEQVSETVGALNRHLASAAQELGFSVPPDDLRAPHYLCLRRKTGISRELPEMLAREKVFVSVRGTSIRVTPHVYNTVADCDRLISCLKQTVSVST
ncbi:MAG TPA: aminotransferase class V-fold PLP-dependent enzyme [Terriglobales bacterium]|jgi:selenocysteine lyase/cysteine desulfurase|nr:aminotransferase class V-fold PLP-dependent enzyme [Terriglobales bacterium]